jgi:hypothetical protein
VVSKESRLKRRRKNADYGCALASATFFITSSILPDLNSKGILSDQEVADALTERSSRYTASRSTMLFKY